MPRTAQRKWLPVRYLLFSSVVLPPYSRVFFMAERVGDTTHPPIGANELFDS
jgi:hypothetical protein